MEQAFNEFIGLDEVEARFGVTYRTLRLRVQSGELVLYRDGRNRRRRLVRVSDLEALFGPQMIDAA